MAHARRVNRTPISWALALAVALTALPVGPAGAAFASLPPGTGHVTGTVTATADGSPLQGVNVTALVLEGGRWVTQERTSTSIDGRYDLPSMPVGSFRVLFGVGFDATYIQEYYGGTYLTDPSPPARVTIATEGQTLGGIDAQMEVGGVIEGDLVGPRVSETVWSAWVEALTLVGGKWTRVSLDRSEVSLTPLAGRRYRLGGLPSGEYIVRAWSDKAYLPGYHESACAPADARVVSVSAAATTSATDVELRAQGFLAAGHDRYQTAAAASAATFPDGGCNAVVLATGEAFPDALAASGLAGALGGPVLLAPSGGVPPCTSAEIERLGASHVYIVGGTRVLPASIARDLAAITGVSKVTRIDGASRYETAAKVADEIVRLTGAPPASAFLVSGTTFADAVAAAPIAYANSAPILLTEGDRLTPVTRWALARVQPIRLIVAGGERVVTASVERSARAQVPVCERVSGSDRVWTARRLAERAFALGWTDLSVVGIATGSDYPDALAAGAAVGRRGGALLLVETHSLPAPVKGFLLARRESTIKWFTVVGGGRAVSPGVAAQVANALEYYESP